MKKAREERYEIYHIDADRRFLKRTCYNNKSALIRIFYFLLFVYK